jgi:hypothetical protein
MAAVDLFVIVSEPRPVFTVAAKGAKIRHFLA